jgi:hypothetical protein
MSMPGVPVLVRVLAMLGLVAAVLIVPVLVMPMLAVPMLIVLALVAPVPVVMPLSVRLAVRPTVSMVVVVVVVVVAAVPMAMPLGPLSMRQRIRHPARHNLALHRVFMLMRVCMPPKHQLLDDEEHAEPGHQGGADTVRPSRSHALHRLGQ